MPKSKKPAPKGGKKPAAPKKVAKKKPSKIIKSVNETRAGLKRTLTARQIDQFNADKMRADAFNAAVQAGADVLVEEGERGFLAAPKHPTVEEQFEADAALYGAPPARFDPTKHGVVGISHETGVTFHNGTMPKPSLLRRAWNGVKRAFNFRSSKTGRYVKPEFAQANPDTTVREKAD